MRQLNRLNQFQRLWQQSQGAPQQTCVAEMASRCFCSDRHLRTLLSQWQHAGWLRWQGESGRGKLGTLTFLRSPEQLRQQLLQTQLQAGNAAEALQVLDMAPERLVDLLRPLMGGQWQNDAPVLRIPYYRPLDSVAPLQIVGRAEQHLARQLFSGLTRFEAGEPVGDLAHHWQHADEGRVWLFWLRPQLFWHNDEPLQAAQLVEQFQRILQDARAAPAGGRRKHRRAASAGAALSAEPQRLLAAVASGASALFAAPSAAAAPRQRPLEAGALYARAGAYREPYALSPAAAADAGR